MPGNHDWEKYEDAIYRYYSKKPNFLVRRDVRLPTPSGRTRQIDVFIETIAGEEFPVRIAIEAKHYREKIDSDTFDAIRTKFVSVGVDLGVIYCPLGLESGPMSDLKTSANPKILLRQKSLDDMLSENWGEDILSVFDQMVLAKVATDPSVSLQADVIDSIERISLYARFFFYKLDNATWLPILSESGVFERALRGENQVPPLLAAEYVARFVELEPDHFVRFCEGVTQPLQWFEGDFFKAALKLPKSHKSRFARAATTWPFQSVLDTEPIIAFLTDLLQEGDVSEMLDLHRQVTQLEEKPSETNGFWVAESIVSEYEFRELTRGFLSRVVCQAPRKIFDYSRRRLCEAMALEEPLDPDGFAASGSVTSFVHEGEFGPHGPVDLLLYTVRDVAVALGRCQPDMLLEFALEDISGGGNKALQRVSLFALAECEEVRGRAVEKILLVESIWHNYSVIPELEYLVKRSWPNLSEEVREAITSRVMSLRRFEYRTDDVGPEDAEKYRKGHVIDWLLLLKGLGLPTQLEEQATAMLDAYSSETGKTARIEHVDTQVVALDPVPDEARNFASKTVDEILTYCEQFEASYGVLEEKTPRGVADRLKEEVVRRPADFLPFASRIVTLPYPAYHSAVADGFREALLEKSSSLDRGLAAQALLDVVGNLKYLGRKTVGRDSFNYGDPQWVRNAVAGFLDQAAQSDPRPLASQAQLFDLWRALWPNAKGDPGAEGDLNALTEVINSEAGQLSMALCRLTLRTMSTAPGESAEECQERETWKKKLLEEIDRELLKSDLPVVRAPLGLFFTGFFKSDKAWTGPRTDLMFDRSNQPIWEAAWSCHFWMSQRYTEVFQHLRDHYLHALDVAVEDDSHRRDWVGNMGVDFAIFWMIGKLSEGDPLLGKFWQRAPKRSKREATFWINGQLSESGWAENWPKAKRWWELALASHRQGNPSSSLSEFLHWLELAPDDLSLTSIEELVIAGVSSERRFLDKELYQFLQIRSEGEPEACARVAAAIASNAAGSPGFWFGSSLEDLLRSLYRTGDEATREILVKAQKTLLSGGLFSFRDVFGDEPDVGQ